MNATTKVEALVLRAREGDLGALEQLLVESEPALLRLSQRACPPQDVEDAVQEVLLRASRQIGTLRVAGAFMAWSFRMLVRQCLRFSARASRFVQLGEEGFVRATPTALDLGRALTKLDDGSRQVLLFRDVLGHTGPETARALGISLESEKSRLRRARAALRVELQI